MNRQRELVGGNGYERELGFNPISFLSDRIQAAPDRRLLWLDLCCGAGIALVQATKLLQASGSLSRASIIGIDLVDAFVPYQASCLELTACPVEDYLDAHPDLSADLVTCVHGMHYIGDKLDLLEQSSAHLSTDGRFVANIDLHSIKSKDGRSLRRQIHSSIVQWGGSYLPRHRRLTLTGPYHRPMGLVFDRASDKAGPNYTGQESVDSYYDGAGDMPSVPRQLIENTE